MILKRLHTLIFISAFVVQQSCITPFTIHNSEVEAEILAVEGDIIIGGDTKIYLSLMVSLDVNYDATFITDAIVWVEGMQGDTYPSTLINEENAQPYFLIDTKSLSLDEQYKLCILLTNGISYESDFLTSLRTPEIGFIDFAVNESRTAVEFFVTTLGDTDSSPYYRWSYTEDWEFTATFRASFYYDPLLDAVVAYPYHPNNTYAYYCWGHTRSNSILIAKTDYLQENFVHQKKLNTIYNVNYKISNLYSMEVYQMSISKEAYTYWSTLEKYTGEIGSIFTPQLDWLNGNLHCVSNPEAKVIGYVSSGTLSVKRIFVDELDIQIYKPDYACNSLLRERNSAKDMVAAGYQILNPMALYLWFPVHCVDCRASGTKNKPSFWPNDHV